VVHEQNARGVSDHLTVSEAMIPRERCAVEDETVGQLAERVAHGPNGPVLVLDSEGELIGQVRMRFLVQAMMAGAGANTEPLDGVIARRAAGRAAVIAEPEMSLSAAREAMLTSGADHVRVERDGILLGIVPRVVLLAFTYEAPDGLPLPPRELTRLVMGDVPRVTSRESFIEGGVLAASWIASIMRAHGYEVEDLRALLDFGCGCGRVIRHWQHLKDAQVFGTDYDPRMVEWCAANLPFARFSINEPEPGLPFSDGSLDFAYALSVFTHLPERLQVPWVEELTRVLAPGGALLVTLHGKSFLHDLDDSERRAFAAGEIVVHNPERVGEQVCAAFHPQRYVRETFAAGLDVAALIPNAAVGMGQDVVLLRKPV
jgi:SAM-dependent methyltransferase